MAKAPSATRTPANGSAPGRLRRSESFFGVHFDFHASDDCTQVGKDVTPRMIQQFIDEVRPDYLQCDCKGHRGLCSYPTDVGHRAPGFVRDPLRIWRDVTARNGVSLFMHYSGVWDIEAMKRHPSWAAVDAKGKREQKASLLGPYADRLLIPQLKELRGRYGVDGMWIDGECWAVVPDYSKAALADWTKASGQRHVPRKNDDPLYPQFLAFHRQRFLQYLRHYVDALHAWDRDFQIASNWAFTSFVPEPVSANVDFLSGDYSPTNSVNAARFEARCIAPQNMPWDLMAWGFAGDFSKGDWSVKTAPQLMREAAVVIALGGGFQVYFQQNRDASINLWQTKVIAPLARFCRARQPFCHKAQAVPQVAVFRNAKAWYARSKAVFGHAGYSSSLHGVLNYLLESGHSVEVLTEHQLSGREGQYPLIVIPDEGELTPSWVRRLGEYARRGGSLLLAGPGVARQFERLLGVRRIGKPLEKTKRAFQWDGLFAVVQSTWQQVKPGKGAKVLAWSYDNQSGKTGAQPAATITKLGKGRIAAMYFEPGLTHHTSRQSMVRWLLDSMAIALYEPMVTVEGSQHVDVTLMRKDGRLSVNLVNTAGPHDIMTVYTHDHIPPVGPLEVAIRLPRRPRRIVRQPQGRAVRFEYSRGVATVTIDRLQIHDVLVVE